MGIAAVANIQSAGKLNSLLFDWTGGNFESTNRVAAAHISGSDHYYIMNSLWSSNVFVWIVTHDV